MVRDILLLQKRELNEKLKEKYIERNIDFKKFNNDMIKVITGPRRAGKSFFSIHTLNRLGNFGYVNFDDERLIGLKDYDEIISAMNSIYNEPKYLLLDEIQNLEKWELFASRLQRQGYNLIITGSNSKLLSTELAAHLTGRHLAITIFPFSFKEFLKTGEKELTENEIKEKLHFYLTYGGYPEPLVKGVIDYRDYLSTLFDSIIYKDIVKRFRIRFIQAIEDLATYLISNTTKAYSYNTLSKITKCKSVHTVEKYLNYLEESFIFFRLNRFSFKIKEQISAPRKIYCVDNGLIYAKAFRFSRDIGKLYENIVCIELKKLEVSGVTSIFYWKNPQHEEVDFVVKEGTKVKKLIQVCYNVDDIDTKKREVRALIKASQELKCNNLLVITDDFKAVEEVNWYGTKRKIKFVPLREWLCFS